MELRELLVIDPDSLTPAQAQQVTKDVIDVMSRGVQASDQKPLQKLLITAQEKVAGHKVGETVVPGIRAQVRGMIDEAEDRGDKRTARILAESMAKQDMAALDDSGQALIDAANKFMEDEIASRERALHERQAELIRTRTQEIWHAHGWEITEEEARKRATEEIVGPPAYEDDINPGSAA